MWRRSWGFVCVAVATPEEVAGLAGKKAPGGRWLFTPLKPDAGGQALPDAAAGRAAEPLG